MCVKAYSILRICSVTYQNIQEGQILLTISIIKLKQNLADSDQYCTCTVMVLCISAVNFKLLVYTG